MIKGLQVKKLPSVTIQASPVPLSSERLLTAEFEVYNITGNDAIYIGSSTSVDSSWIPRAAATSTIYTSQDIPGEKKHFDLSEIYVAGTAGEQLIVQYVTTG